MERRRVFFGWKEGQKPQKKKESHPMASFAEAPAGDVAKGTR
jgi:hypothetical protein